jgi:hypothetical protein
MLNIVMKNHAWQIAIFDILQYNCLKQNGPLTL